MAKTGLLNRVILQGSSRLNSFASAAAESIVRSSFQAMITCDKLQSDFLSVATDEVPYRNA